MLNVIIITAIVTVLIYSTVTFIISNIASNDDVDQMLAWGAVGMTLWFITIPIRKYTRNGFYILRIYKDGELINTVTIKGGEKSYQELRKKYPKDEFDCFSDHITFTQYLRNKVVRK